MLARSSGLVQLLRCFGTFSSITCPTAVHTELGWANLKLMFVLIAASLLAARFHPRNLVSHSRKRERERERERAGARAGAGGAAGDR